MGYSNSFAYGINDLGQIVGYFGRSLEPWDLGSAYMFDSKSGRRVLVGYLSQINQKSRAFGINNNGQIVGDSMTDKSGLSMLFYTHQEVSSSILLHNPNSILKQRA